MSIPSSEQRLHGRRYKPNTNNAPTNLQDDAQPFVCRNASLCKKSSTCTRRQATAARGRHRSSLPISAQCRKRTL